MKRVQDGDLSAFGLLYVRHRPAVLFACRRLIKDSHAARDLVQDTFIRALTYRHSFRHEARFKTWLLRISRNVCYDYLSLRDRHREILAMVHDERSLLRRTHPADEPVSEIQSALAKLPPDMQEVLYLSRYHGLKYAEIAKLCQCSEGAIKVRVHRAINQLRLIYKTNEHE